MERPRREAEEVGLEAARCFLGAVSRDRLHTGRTNADVPQRRVGARLAVKKANIVKVLGERGIHSQGDNAVLKQMRALHRAGELNAKIQRYHSLLWSGAIVNPAPGFTQDILEEV
uniref:Uncharacterized protein n=1 Tax=Hyaloperonospora arabidopsidis (strain Emoy2) TaxID=559515 RepID=M4BQE4_HYAAE